MASGRPKVAESPLELLTSPPNIEQSILSKIWFPTVGAVTGFTGVCIANYVNHQPKLSGIQKHIFVTVLCVAAATWADKYRNQYLADRDAITRHYVELHPEDFPPYEKKKISELFLPWTPIR